MSVSHWLIDAARLVPGATVPQQGLILEGDITTKWAATIRSSGVSAGALADSAAEYMGLMRADFSLLEPGFAKQIPESVVRTHLTLPLAIEGSRALVAVADPADAKHLDELAFSLGMPIEACLANPNEIEEHLANLYGQEAGDLNWNSVSSSLLAEDLLLRRKDGTNLSVGTSATSKLLIELLKRSFHLGASDLHIQPYGYGAIVRNRVDGVLYRALELPAKVHLHLVRHVKAISGMDSTKSMVPQDGELHMELEHRSVDLRLSVLPVTGSERLVIRLLPQDQVRSLAMLRLEEAEQNTLEKLANSTEGLILMTGPTGSGKTSLLYAMLAEKNTPNINIMSVEEPVEYRLRGASQVDVTPQTGLTFSKSLRSILRQDPDVVMIGEIRDEETAEIAAQAALTGHFVLSTVHTLDALLATVRMRDLGVSSATLADAIAALASQRLVRALCDDCKQPIENDQLSEDEQRFAALCSTPKWRSAGCASCRSTGFKGRLPVLEIVQISDELKLLLRQGSEDIAEMERLAALGGTRFLAEGFAQRVEQGTTTIAEVLRVYGLSFFHKLEHLNNLRRVLGDSPNRKEGHE